VRRLALLFALGALLGLGPGAVSASAAGPTAVGEDGQGVSYAGFASGGSIKRFDANGNALSSWGTAGNGTGQIGAVVAIDVGPDGNVWVLDDNLRVQEFTPSGSYITGLTLPGCASGVSPSPTTRGGLDVSNSWILVSHPCSNEIDEYAAGGCLCGPPQVQNLSTAPKGLSYGPGPSGEAPQVYVAEPNAHQLQSFELPQHGGFIARHTVPVAVSGGPQVTPTDVFDDTYGQIIVSDSANNFILFLDSNNGYSEYRHLGRTGSNAGDLDNPVAFDVHGQDGSNLAGNLFIADYGNSRVQRWNSYGYTFWASAATAGGGGGVPVIVTPPAISGNPVQGQQVSCSSGSWTNSPASYAYTWQRDGANIGGATSSDYTIVAADVNHQLTCRVIASNGSGSSQPATSQPVVPSAGQAPSNTNPPTISGQAVEGGTLTCNPGTWTGSPNFAYAWRRDGNQIATGSSYTVVAADISHALTCAVTGSNLYGSTTAVSAAVTPTAAGNGGTVGVSVNSGAVATNNPAVTLTIHEPAGTTSIIVSNDGGFSTPQALTVTGNDTYSWTLATSGAERLPKTVYVRFRGPGIDDTQTYSDDVILDQTPPHLNSALASSAGTSGRALRAGGGPSILLRTRAGDGASGVATLEAAKRRNGRSETVGYKRRLQLSGVGSRPWVRVIDAAGNPSHWRHARVR